MSSLKRRSDRVIFPHLQQGKRCAPKSYRERTVFQDDHFEFTDRLFFRSNYR